MNLMTTSSPHIRSKETTGRIMLDVLIALVPTLAAGTIIFGVRALLVALVSMASAIVAEAVFSLILGRGFTAKDGSAAVTGLLLALTLPASVPYWLAAVGAAFAIVVAKVLCGGIGQNIFNPALAGRAFLLILWPASLVRYAAPGTALGMGATVDIVSSSTPLHDMVMPSLPHASLMDMFLGNIGGTIGEVCALALLIGGAYLVYRKVISLRIPLAYLGTVAVLTLIFARTGNPFVWMLYSLLGGGVMIGAIFMATDYATSPVTAKGQILYGIGCGGLTVLFRYFGLYPEGVTYAILIMNACAWGFDRYTAPRRFGKKGGNV